MQQGPQVSGDVIQQLWNRFWNSAALETGALGKAVVSTAVHGAMNMSRVPLPVFRALETICGNRSLQLLLEIGRVATIGLLEQPIVSCPPGRPRARIPGRAGYDVAILKSTRARESRETRI
jgi:hypothetical protein